MFLVIRDLQLHIILVRINAMRPRIHAKFIIGRDISVQIKRYGGERDTQFVLAKFVNC